MLDTKTVPLAPQKLLEANFKLDFESHSGK